MKYKVELENPTFKLNSLKISSENENVEQKID